MKKTIVFILLIAFACTPKVSSVKPMISVSILPQKFFVEKIAGDLVDVNVLVPPGASPELYSLMASQMIDLSKSVAWLRIGKIGFEENWTTKISQATPDLTIFDTSSKINWIENEETEEDEEDEDEHQEHVHLHGIDPHIWLSPDEVKLVSDETYQALVALLPDNEKLLTENYESFLKEISQLDVELEAQFDQLENRSFLIFHPALTYLARQYDLQQIALEVDGKEPSPKYMQTFVEIAKSENIKVIFIQKEFDKDNALQLANEIGGEVIQIDPMNEFWDTQIREIATKITSASKQ